MNQANPSTRGPAEVAQALEQSEAFRALAPETRAQMARDLAKVFAYVSDPGAGQNDLRAVAQAQPRRATGAGQQGTGADFTAGALREGVDQFTRLVDEVDFPEFVSGLIDGVFTSIVDSSIRQMEAYSKMLEAVVSSVQEFADQNISEDDGRKYLRDKYPRALQTVQTETGPRLQLNPELDDDQLPDLRGDFGLDLQPDFDDPQVETQLVNAARLKMARLKQQHLATMVLMGINRIIVTDGRINAKVRFDFRSEDRASASDVQHQERASDQTSEDTSERGGKRSDKFTADWRADQSSAKYDASRSQFYKQKSTLKATVSSAATRDRSRTSDSAIDATASLLGEVRINFRSETFPLDRLNPADMSLVQGRANEPAR